MDITQYNFLPKREGFCPAYFLCAKYGNERTDCRKGTEKDVFSINTEKCLATIVLMLGAERGDIILNSPLEKEIRAAVGFRPPAQGNEQSS